MVAKVLRTIQVGVGGVGRGHFRRLMESERFRHVAVCDAYPRRADVAENLKCAREAGIPVFSDFRRAFDQVEADVAFICTPHHWHAPMTIAALEHGLHVFVEKPATSSAADARRMLAAQQQAGKMVTVGFNPTTSPACIGLKRHIARGDLGEIREVVAVVNWYRADDYYRRAGWVGREKVEGMWCRDGVIYNQATHALAAALMLASTEPAPALAQGGRARADMYRAHPVRTLAMEDLACAVVQLDTPARTRLYFYPTTCNQARTGTSWIRVFGDKGAATLGASHLELYDGRRRALTTPARLPSKHDDVYRAITRGATPFNPLAEAVKVTYTTEAMYHAAGREIKRIKWADLGDLTQTIERAAAQRCLFSELDAPPPWA